MFACSQSQQKYFLQTRKDTMAFERDENSLVCERPSGVRSVGDRSPSVNYCCLLLLLWVDVFVLFCSCIFVFIYLVLCLFVYFMFVCLFIYF